jgi:2-oxoglutarate dehydrogenase complex dehydrogenase (E1) component-like enzyme
VGRIMTMKVKFTYIKYASSEIDVDEICEYFNLTVEEWKKLTDAEVIELLEEYYCDTIGELVDDCCDETDYKIEIED